MSDMLSAVLLLLGATFCLLAAVGVVRLPDLFTRMQAAAKSATLGMGCTALAAAVHFDTLEVKTLALLVTVFLLFTAPVGAHLIARAAYYVGTPLGPHAVVDQWRPHLKDVPHRDDRPIPQDRRSPPAGSETPPRPPSPGSGD